MERKHRISIDLTYDSDEPAPKRQSLDEMSSPLAIIPITVNPAVTQEVECQSPPSQDMYDDEHHEELRILSKFYEEKKGYMRLKLCSSTRDLLTNYDISALEAGDLFEIELGPHDRQTTLGREVFMAQLQKAAILCLGVKSLSSRHCLIEWSPDSSLYVTDLGSTNGTVINATPLAPHVRTKICHGDIIRLAYMKTHQKRSCKIQYQVEDPSLSRIDTPFKSPPLALGNNVLGILFAGPLCYSDGERLRPHEMLNFQKEYEGLRKSLNDAAKQHWNDHIEQDGLHMVHVPPSIDVSVSFATMDALTNMISSKCRALHFSGHGATDRLYFESDERQGMADPIPYAHLVKILRVPAQLHLRLVVVNSCSSEFVAKAFVDCGVPHVIAIRGDSTVEDSEAAHFTEAFYLCLATGRHSIEECFHEALKTISYSPHRHASRDNGFKKFTLLPEGGNHHEIVFQSIVVPKAVHVPSQTHFPEIWRLPKEMFCSNFRFRSLEQLRLCGYLTEESDVKFKRWVWITGKPGVGKTQLAYACASYLGPRMAFLGGVYVLNILTLIENGDSIDESAYHIHQRIYDKIESKLDDFRVAASRRIQSLHKLTRHIHGSPMLVVLDGCDDLLRENANMFTTFLNTKLMENIGLKILTTSQYFYQTEYVHDHGLYVFETPAMTRKASAKLLIDFLVPRKLSVEELKRSPQYKQNIEDTPENVLALLIDHPITFELCGIPRSIYHCAYALRNSPSITVDSWTK